MSGACLTEDANRLLAIGSPPAPNIAHHIGGIAAPVARDQRGQEREASGASRSTPATAGAVIRMVRRMMPGP